MPTPKTMRDGTAGERPRERRALVRTALRVEKQKNWCTLRTARGESATAQVLDINVGGCRLEIMASQDAVCLARIEHGEVLEFLDCSLRRWSSALIGMRARVIWVEGRELGCRFATVLCSRDLKLPPQVAADETCEPA